MRSVCERADFDRLRHPTKGEFSDQHRMKARVEEIEFLDVAGGGRG